MPISLLAVAAALLGGLAIGVQNPLASLMGQRIGVLASAFVVHAGGAVAAALVLLAAPGQRLDAWRTVPWYALGAGALGVVLVATVSVAIPRIGIAATVGCLVLAQLATAAWLDHVGAFGVDVRALDLRRAAGLVLILAGAWLALK